MSDASSNLAANLRELRERSGISQTQAAARAGIPRATWANLESSSANPTLQVLLAASRALGVTVEELLAPPRSACRLYLAADLPVRRRGGGAMRRLLPEPLPGLELDRLELEPDGVLVGVPHTAGTREYLTCEAGRIELSAAGESWALGPGDVLVFRGDQKHSYKNLGRGRAVAYSVVVLA